MNLLVIGLAIKESSAKLSLRRGKEAGQSASFARKKQIARNSRVYLCAVLTLTLCHSIALYWYERVSVGGPYKPIVLPMISFMISSVPPPIGPRRASRTARSMPYSRM